MESYRAGDWKICGLLKIKIKEIIQKLSEYNQEAEFRVIAHNKVEPFTFSFGGWNGCNKSNCEEVNLFLDKICISEGE